MHLSEFKAWFEGFTEEMKGPPTKDQWAKIRKHVKEISADYTPSPVFIDRYVYPWRRHWEPYWTLCGTSVSGVTSNTTGSSGLQATAADYRKALAAAPSLADWSHAGRAEYRSTI